MKHYIKTAIDTLGGLGFTLDHDDHEKNPYRSRFTHAYEPETTLSLNHKGSETQARTVVQRARVIAGLDSADVAKPKVVSRIKADRAAERDRRRAATSAAAARRAEEEARRLAARRQVQVKSLDRMMRGGTTAPSAVTLRGEWITPEQLADETGLTDSAIRHAIKRERINLYRVGAKQMLKTTEAMAWARTSITGAA